ncbi:MAG: DUF1294 domain-containing protein [Dorea sp.]|nr:DUF1294 domain-containing protein [Dorea sp.]
MKVMEWYIVWSNLAAFLVYGLDKRRARQHQWRISERTLLGLALIGGSAGALAGMYLFRHKTKKLKFVVGVPVILAVQLILIYFVISKGAP